MSKKLEERKVSKKKGKIKVTSKEERYKDHRGEDVIKTTYPDGTVVISAQ